jgi:hypothetical protein
LESVSPRSKKPITATATPASTNRAVRQGLGNPVYGTIITHSPSMIRLISRDMRLFYHDHKFAALLVFVGLEKGQHFGRSANNVLFKHFGELSVQA